MSRATRTDTQSRADSHDLIRVQGARVNNLKDVSIEIPKRRLTVFTGVSGSGKRGFLIVIPHRRDLLSFGSALRASRPERRMHWILPRRLRYSKVRPAPHQSR